MKRVLIGWDGSSDARHTLRVAVELAEDLDGEIVVLEVLHQAISPETSGEERSELERHRRELKDAVVGAVRDPQAAERLHHEVITSSDVGSALCEHATKHGFDLLVIGRHGVDRAVHSQMGRVTEYEVRHCSCPVLVVGPN